MMVENCWKFMTGEEAGIKSATLLGPRGSKRLWLAQDETGVHTVIGSDLRPMTARARRQPPFSSIWNLSVDRRHH